jgi:phage gpG-like protein
VTDFALDDGGGLELLASRFKAASRKIRNLMLDVMERECEAVLDVAKLRLAELFPNPAKMQAALQSEVTVGAGNTIFGRVQATGLPYLAIHEFGGRTAPHDIFPVNAKALHFFADHAAPFRTGATAATNEVFAAHVSHPGSLMPERSYLRYALAQRRAALREAFAGAAVDSLKGD